MMISPVNDAVLLIPAGLTNSVATFTVMNGS